MAKLAAVLFAFAALLVAASAAANPIYSTEVVGKSRTRFAVQAVTPCTGDVSKDLYKSPKKEIHLLQGEHFRTVVVDRNDGTFFVPQSGGEIVSIQIDRNGKSARMADVAPWDASEDADDDIDVDLRVLRVYPEQDKLMVLRGATDNGDDEPKYLGTWISIMDYDSQKNYDLMKFPAGFLFTGSCVFENLKSNAVHFVYTDKNEVALYTIPHENATTFTKVVLDTTSCIPVGVVSDPASGRYPAVCAPVSKTVYGYRPSGALQYGFLDIATGRMSIVRPVENFGYDKWVPMNIKSQLVFDPSSRAVHFVAALADDDPALVSLDIETGKPICDQPQWPDMPEGIDLLGSL